MRAGILDGELSLAWSEVSNYDACYGFQFFEVDMPSTSDLVMLFMKKGVRTLSLSNILTMI